MTETHTHIQASLIRKKQLLCLLGKEGMNTVTYYLHSILTPSKQICDFTLHGVLSSFLLASGQVKLLEPVG